MRRKCPDYYGSLGKMWKYFGTKSERRLLIVLNAPGTETPQSHHIESWKNSPFPLLALWGNKNGLPSMKVKELENFQNKMGLKGCKWSSLNAPGTETPQSYPYWELGVFPLSEYG